MVIKNKYICNQQVGEKFCLELESLCSWQNTVPLIYIALIPSAFWFKLSWITSDSVYAIFSIYKIFLHDPFYFLESPWKVILVSVNCTDPNFMWYDYWSYNWMMKLKKITWGTFRATMRVPRTQCKLHQQMVAQGSWSLWRHSLCICKQAFLRPLTSYHHSLVMLKCMLPTCLQVTNCLSFMEPWRHECLEIFSSLLNYARRVEMSENVEYNWETVLHETWPHCEVVESLWLRLEVGGEGVVAAHHDLACLLVRRLICQQLLAPTSGHRIGEERWGWKPQCEKTHQFLSYYLRVIYLFIVDVDNF